MNWVSWDRPLVRVSLLATGTVIRRSPWPAFALATLGLTHGYIMACEAQTIYTHCRVRLSIKYILVDCPRYKNKIQNKEK